MYLQVVVDWVVKVIYTNTFGIEMELRTLLTLSAMKQRTIVEPSIAKISEKSVKSNAKNSLLEK